jgi:formylmethanofuran dehydrogenase subunit E
MERGNKMRSFDEDLQAAAAYHGHLCTGMFMGVRMARYGLKLLGIDDPFTFKDLIVYVEIYRCASEAICVVTGCTLGRKRLKLVNYGKMAATFVNLAESKAVRLSPNGYINMPEGVDAKEFWSGFNDEELFIAREVCVHIPPKDLPGKPQSKAKCAVCGETVLDGREVEKDGVLLCLSCAAEPYYQTTAFWE